jgi:hypothetical protein
MKLMIENASIRANPSFSLIIFVTGCIAPTFLSLIRFVPLPSKFAIKLNAYLIDPPLAENATQFLFSMQA